MVTVSVSDSWALNTHWRWWNKQTKKSMRQDLNNKSCGWTSAIYTPNSSQHHDPVLVLAPPLCPVIGWLPSCVHLFCASISTTEHSHHCFSSSDSSSGVTGWRRIEFWSATTPTPGWPWRTAPETWWAEQSENLITLIHYNSFFMGVSPVLLR